MANQKGLREKAASVPVLGYFGRVFSNIINLPKRNAAILEDLSSLQQAGVAAQEGSKKQLEQAEALYSDINTQLAAIQLNQDNLKQQIALLGEIPVQAAVSSGNSSDALFADDHVLDRFYIDFEDKFRGSEQLISKRLEEYLPLFKNSPVDFEKKPVLDIGSGRGEFQQLLKKHKLNSLGLDINHDMVKRAKTKGLKAVQGDALSFLQKAKPQSYGAITGFHIVEHIPFNLLLRIFDNAHRALARDGFVLFETPNPENIIVASAGFYTDPSHLNPLPPDLLAFALETCGFRNVELRRIHPVEAGEAEVAGLPAEVATRFYGPRDYAVVGYK